MVQSLEKLLLTALAVADGDDTAEQHAEAGIVAVGVAFAYLRPPYVVVEVNSSMLTVQFLLLYTLFLVNLKVYGVDEQFVSAGLLLGLPVLAPMFYRVLSRRVAVLRQKGPWRYFRGVA